MLKTYSTLLPTELHQFAESYSAMQSQDRSYALELVQSELSKVAQNQALQKRGYNKRQANSLLIDVAGKLDSVKKCTERHVETLEGKIRSAHKQIKKWEKQLSQYPHPCCNRRRNGFKSVQHRLHFNIHHKRRYIIDKQRKLEALQNAPLHVNLGKPENFVFVGSQDESQGNQICQYDGTKIKIRLPESLDNGSKYATADLTFPYGQDAINAALLRRAIKNKQDGTTEVIPSGKGEALTFRIYKRENRWYISLSVDVTLTPRQSLPVRYGCIGVDFNPGVIGWAYVDTDGNIRDKGQFRVNLHSRRSGQITATLSGVAARLSEIAQKYDCPIAAELLDFSAKKKRLRESGRRYARMLNAFAYGEWDRVLQARCDTRGIDLIHLNPAYSSLIGLTKFMKRYGLSSDTAAAMVLARRAMKLSERVPGHVARLRVNRRRHVWSAWNALNRKLKGVRRHSFFTESNRLPKQFLPGMIANASLDDLTGSGVIQCLGTT